MWVPDPPEASAQRRRYNRRAVLSRLRRSIALKLILASAIPSAAVLLIGLGALVGHSHWLSARDPAMAFYELRNGAVLGTLLALTFAGMTIALAARHFLIKPIQALSRVMARAELGDFLVRARVQTEDELGKLARSFNTMLARVTDMAVADIETKESLAKLEADLSLQSELKAVNARLEAHVVEMELLLEVSKAVSGTLDLPEQLETLGRHVCDRLGISEFSVMLVDDATYQLAEPIAAQAALAIANARLYQQTLELSFTDPLTGVPNRRQLFLRLENELSRCLRFGDPLSLLMIDLDLFKRINDAHGHTVGDGGLRGVALALRRSVRKIDIVARYGGEEFCVVLPRVAKPEAIEVAEKLRRAVAAAPMPGPDGQTPLSVTISIGVATLAIDAEDVAVLIDKADGALYEAKRLGRDRVATALPL